jgi:hypothetical protein
MDEDSSLHEMRVSLARLPGPGPSELRSSLDPRDPRILEQIPNCVDCSCYQREPRKAAFFLWFDDEIVPVCSRHTGIRVDMVPLLEGLGIWLAQETHSS